MNNDALERYKRRNSRERKARKEAEQLLEHKSLELFRTNQKLLQAHDELEQRVIDRTSALRAANELLLEEIEERKKVEDELAAARDRAVEASELKSEFLANMSHEIRTPLNAVIGLANLLLDTPLNVEQRDFLETIHNSGDSLLTIINDILDFSRIEANKLDLENQPFDLRDCVEDAIDLLAAKAIEKDIELAYRFETPMPERFIGDVTRLRQILVNLLGNALKFTHEGEVLVTVRATAIEADNYQLHLTVKDSGIGIPDERLTRLFQAFSQVDASTTRKYGGTGLGLAISKRLSELMGGKMWVESEVGVGSQFHCTIMAVTLQSEEGPELQRPQADLQGKRVLIVDDNETNRSILQQQVEAWGMLPTTISSAEATLNWLQYDSKFALGIIDMKLPNMNGVMLTRAIQKQCPEATFPKILLASIGQRPQDATNELFAAYANKPLKPAMLQRALIAALTNDNDPTQQELKPQFDNELAENYPLKILLAEDNLINQKVAIRMLGRLGYRADVAGNGLEVLQALKRQIYDVILMDVQMPELDGVATTKRIIESTTILRKPIIIAMTANALKGDREQFLEAGMDDYISKPVRMEKIAESLQRAAEQRQYKLAHIT